MTLFTTGLSSGLGLRARAWARSSYTPWDFSHSAVKRGCTHEDDNCVFPPLVRSFGTETRPTARPMAPSPIYHQTMTFLFDDLTEINVLKVAKALSGAPIVQVSVFLALYY